MREPRPDKGAFVMAPLDGVLTEGHVIRVGITKSRITFENVEDENGRPKSVTRWVPNEDVV
jgi:hypothetical protein